MAEVRTQREGELRIVQGSGSGRTFATASAPVSAIIAFIRDFKITSAQDIKTVLERGVPHHHKQTEVKPIDVTFKCAWTGGFPTALSGSGATVPLWHIEHRASAAEIGNGTTGVYHQFMGFALQSHTFTEGKDEDTIDIKGVCLAYVGPTGSGYLS